MITPVESIPIRHIGRPTVYDTSAIQEFLDSGHRYAYYEIPQEYRSRNASNAIRTAFMREGAELGVKVHKRGPRLYMERV